MQNMQKKNHKNSKAKNIANIFTRQIVWVKWPTLFLIVHDRMITVWKNTILLQHHHLMGTWVKTNKYKSHFILKTLWTLYIYIIVMNYSCMREQYGWDNQTFKCLKMLMQVASCSVCQHNAWNTLRKVTRNSIIIFWSVLSWCKTLKSNRYHYTLRR